MRLLKEEATCQRVSGFLRGWVGGLDYGGGVDSDLLNSRAITSVYELCIVRLRWLYNLSEFYTLVWFI